jgi:hypothetical protein
VVSQTICWDWPWTVILLLAVSQVARITGVSHWRPAVSGVLRKEFHDLLQHVSCSVEIRKLKATFPMFSSN